MAEEMPPKWRNYFFLGLVLLVNTIFIKISFSWPWDSESFTLGVMGLIGLTMLYISWYRFTFKRRGLVPWMDLWKNPETSSKKLLLFSIFTLILSYFLGKNQLFFPDPTSLILSLIALLTLIQATYVYLSVTILSDD
ncbi:MAG: hypothetical protein CL976_05310 [Euryarchaeota archaeon]|jgi:hypothetical protein|nr:hypothetical protein [Euryarchaeota archaeon]|tara:strand:+ start:578 stop:988 length:411 start_codon:yes stop_codon:yes gene_type:complete